MASWESEWYSLSNFKIQDKHEAQNGSLYLTWKKNIYISGPSSIKIKTIRARNDASLYFQELRATQLLRQANKTIKTAGYQIP